MTTFASVWNKLNNQSLYVSLPQEIADFTTEDVSPPDILIQSKEQPDITVPLTHNPMALKQSLATLAINLTYNESPIIVWNIKEFISFVLYKTKRIFSFNYNKLFDLKILENYLGLDQRRPQSYNEALFRLKKIIQNPVWEKSLKKIYFNVYIPLIKEVVPSIETTGVVLKEQKARINQGNIYCHYNITGPMGGRMAADKAFIKCFNPHGACDKDSIRPITLDDEFISFDYKNMEVTMLQWLSKDEEMLKLLESQYDFYEVAFEKITGKQCKSSLHRQFCKKMFLPVFYGVGNDALAASLGIASDIAQKMRTKITSLFAEAARWIDIQENCISNGVGCDVLGRCRNFDADKTYLAKNFAVQSPAALLCLEKLVTLHKAINGLAKIVFSIHDGYVISTAKANELLVCSLAKHALESESEFFPNIKLKTTCQIGGW